MKGRINGLDLFSGIGGITRALAPWVRPVAYCEIDRHCQGVLLSRQLHGELPVAPIWDDVSTLRGNYLPESVDIIYGGFPCQDISVAGLGRGLEGERSKLVFEIFRLARECSPKFIFLENVSAIRTKGGERVAKELAALGFDCRWDCLSAFDVGAPHKRERWFLLAHSHGHGREGLAQFDGAENSRMQAVPDWHNVDRFHYPIPDTQRQPLRDEPWWLSGADGERTTKFRDDGQAESLADASGAGLERIRPRAGGASAKIAATASGSRGRGKTELANAESIGCGGARLEFTVQKGKSGAPASGWWETEPEVGRVAHGVSHRVDRIRSLGNAVVPAQVAEAFRRLIGVTHAQ